jgi:hypothetical protein
MPLLQMLTKGIKNDTLYVFLADGRLLPDWYRGGRNLTVFSIKLNSCTNYGTNLDNNSYIESKILENTREYVLNEPLIGHNAQYNFYLEHVLTSFDCFNEEECYLCITVCIKDKKTRKKIGTQILLFKIDLPPIIQCG